MLSLFPEMCGAGERLHRNEAPLAEVYTDTWSHSLQQTGTGQTTPHTFAHALASPTSLMGPNTFDNATPEREA